MPGMTDPGNWTRRTRRYSTGDRFTVFLTGCPSPPDGLVQQVSTEGFINGLGFPSLGVSDFSPVISGPADNNQAQVTERVKYDPRRDR